MTQQQQNLSQFDIMMKLAQEKDGIAKMFDPAPRYIPELPRNNYLFDKVEVNGSESESRQGNREPPSRAGNFTADGTPSSNVKERLRQLQRIWAAMTKFIASQTGSGRTVDLPLAGKFRKMKENSEEGAIQYSFMPHLDFVGSGHFKFSENEFNVSPFSKASQGFSIGAVTVSLTSIGAVCSLDRESVASALKAIFVGFIKSSRQGRFCKLDLRIGHLVCYPNGSLAFENYQDMAASGLDGPIEVNINDGRFIRRTIGSKLDTSYGSLNPAANRSDMKSVSVTRMRDKDQATQQTADKRSQSLYSSVRINKGGFSKMSNATSVMTPYSNVGGEISRYGGNNRMLKQWYENKGFQPNARQLGFALNKRQINQNEIYSQFSGNAEDLMMGAETRSGSQMTAEDRSVLESLKKNEFLPKVTFDDFLSKKLGKGKRTLFVNKGTSENARQFMKEYMQQAQAKAQAAAESRVIQIEEERNENARHKEQELELREIEQDKKASQQAEHRENVKQGMAEKKMF